MQWGRGLRSAAVFLEEILVLLVSLVYLTVTEHRLHQLELKYHMTLQ